MNSNENRFELFSTKVARVVKSLQAIKSRKMAQYGLKGTTCLCLCQLLDSSGGLSATELAARGEIDKAQVSRCMSELIEKGLVLHEKREGRSYKQKYCLTVNGLAVAEDISTATVRVQALAEQGIDERDLALFYRVLDRLCDNFADVAECEI